MSEIIISEFDKNQLRDLETTSICAIQENGSSTRQVLWDLEEAFRRGFTAVSRGEAGDQKHPEMPTDIDEETVEQPRTAHEWLKDALGRFQVTHIHSSIRGALKAMDVTEVASEDKPLCDLSYLPLGMTLTWTRLVRGRKREWVGKIVDFVYPGQLPDRENYPTLYFGNGVGEPRTQISYIVEVPGDPLRMLAPEICWPAIDSITAVEQNPCRELAHASICAEDRCGRVGGVRGAEPQKLRS